MFHFFGWLDIIVSLCLQLKAVLNIIKIYWILWQMNIVVREKYLLLKDKLVNFHLFSPKLKKKKEKSDHLILMCMHDTKSLQFCLSLCNTMDYSPPGFSVHRILQGGILEWVVGERKIIKKSNILLFHVFLQIFLRFSR